MMDELQPLNKLSFRNFSFPIIQKKEAANLFATSFFSRKPLFPEPKCHVDKGNHYRHFHQRTNYSSKSLAGIDAKNGNGNGNGEFKIIAGSCKLQRG